jgi:hypothetical protein
MHTTYLVTNGQRREMYTCKGVAIHRAQTLGKDYVVKRVNKACNGLDIVYKQ